MRSPCLTTRVLWDRATWQVLAEHPISDATDDELRVKADGLYADLIRQLTTDGPTSQARQRRLRSAEPSAECLAGA